MAMEAMVAMEVMEDMVAMEDMEAMVAEVDMVGMVVMEATVAMEAMVVVMGATEATEAMAAMAAMAGMDTADNCAVQVSIATGFLRCRAMEDVMLLASMHVDVDNPVRNTFLDVYRYGNAAKSYFKTNVCSSSQKYT